MKAKVGLIRTTSRRKKSGLFYTKKTKMGVLYLLKWPCFHPGGDLGSLLAWSWGTVLFSFKLYLECNFYRKLCHLCLNIWRQKKQQSCAANKWRRNFSRGFFARLMQLLLVIKISASGHFSLGLHNMPLHVRGPVFVPGGGGGGRQLDFNPM